jgi:hypothetical protein
MTFQAFQVPPPFVNQGMWFVASFYRRAELPEGKGFDIYQLVDGRVLSTDEIAQGTGAKYAPVPLYERKSTALAVATRANTPKPVPLPFGLEVDQLSQPFCACGRVVSNCDGSRKACKK